MKKNTLLLLFAVLILASCSKGGKAVDIGTEADSAALASENGELSEEDRRAMEQSGEIIENSRPGDYLEAPEGADTSSNQEHLDGDFEPNAERDAVADPIPED